MILDLATVRAHVGVDHEEDDTYLTGLIGSALGHLENMAGRSLVHKELKHHLSQFPSGDYELPWLDPVAITSITYRQPDSSTATVPADEYDLDTSTGTGHSVLYRTDWDSPWPSAQAGNRAVTITANVGWPQEELPDPLVTASLLLIGHWYANREAVSTGLSVQELPHGVESLIDQYRQTVIG
jgi:uncharacterized phiE125 gp8 family phage protein